MAQYIEQCRRNWKEYIERMSSDRIPKMIVICQPKYKRISEDF
jgi:hypothetical protein